ncbi:MAG: TerB family tellurite resistance protein [Burkholderiales bacterium]|nr:TerB family tellurite resistance protein [Burkholderiales bacterium]
MIKSLKALFSKPGDSIPSQRQRLERAIASLVYEVTRMDFEVRPDEVPAAHAALTGLLGVAQSEAHGLLAWAGEPGNRLTTYHDAVAEINRSFPVEDRVRLVEHLWCIAHADDELHVYEDHLVRKLSDLLYVPHIQSMLARQRVRGENGA